MTLASACHLGRRVSTKEILRRDIFLVFLQYFMFFFLILYEIFALHMGQHSLTKEILRQNIFDVFLQYILIFV